MEEAKKILSKKNCIRIRGANEHNLKNVDVDIPRDALVVFTGLSGPGKRRWRLIRSMQRDNGGIWNRYRPMRVSF